MLIWISTAPVSVGYTPTLLPTARPGRDGPRPRASIPRGWPHGRRFWSGGAGGALRLRIDAALADRDGVLHGSVRVAL